MKVRKIHHVIIFGEGSERYSMIDPNSDALGEAAHTARYNLARLTQTQAYLLCEAFECYNYLASQCPTTGLAIEMLRRLRNARDAHAAAPDAKAQGAECWLQRVLTSAEAHAARNPDHRELLPGDPGFIPEAKEATEGARCDGNGREWIRDDVGGWCPCPGCAACRPREGDR